MTPRLTFPLLDDGEAIALLESRCPDWSIHMRDFPRHGMKYEVWAMYFFCGGKGVGRTLGEAAQRALAKMERENAKVPRATAEQMGEI